MHYSLSSCAGVFVSYNTFSTPIVGFFERSVLAENVTSPRIRRFEELLSTRICFRFQDSGLVDPGSVFASMARTVSLMRIEGGESVLRA